ncbi:hypothetical protein ENHY17A_430006 [Moraxellaceae bacterium 17A]|nr:hypothetical protein ENHY17A_430006 [Moraxellaceae bacterium 17A]
MGWSGAYIGCCYGASNLSCHRIFNALHNGVKTPHVLEYGRNPLPNETFKPAKPKNDPIPARPDEIQYHK